MRWEPVRPWVEGLPPSLVHSLLSTSIYLVDAVQDVGKDSISGRFNGIIASQGVAWSRPAMRHQLFTELEIVTRALLSLPEGPPRRVCLEVLRELSHLIERALPDFVSISIGHFHVR